mgnify:CR=1 FL=1
MSFPTASFERGGMQIRTWSGLMKALQVAAQEATKKAGEEIKEVLRFYVQKNWYNAHTPSQYERTMQMIDSISVRHVKENANKYSAVIYFDFDRIAPASNIYDRGPYQFNTHMSLDGSTSYAGKSIGEFIVRWANEGQDNPLTVGGKSVFPREGAYFLEDTYEYAQDETVQLINEALRQAGFESVIVG